MYLSSEIKKIGKKYLGQISWCPTLSGALASYGDGINGNNQMDQMIIFCVVISPSATSVSSSLFIGSMVRFGVSNFFYRGSEILQTYVA